MSAMSATPPPFYDPRTAPGRRTLKPYLELPHLLSLTWLAYPILSLLFVAFRLQLSSASAQDAVGSAKDDLVASCKAAEQAATAAASMPRYMAAATNARITDAVNDTMKGARAALVLALTVMEAIINFIVDTYRSTFLCFLELVVRGGLSILIGAVQELNSFIENTFNGIRTGIQNDVAKANSAIQTAIDAINKVNPFGDISVPQFSIPSLAALQNVTLPTDFEDTLVKLNNSLPSLSDLKDKVDNLIDTPFELVKKDINDTFAGLSFEVNALPVPAQNTVQFCDQMDTSVVDDLGRDLVKIAKIGTIILILVAILLIGANCALEWYKWRCMKKHLQYIREAWTSDPSLHQIGSRSSDGPVLQLTDHNLLMLHGNMLHPLLTKIANRISSLMRLSPRTHINLSWFFHYVFHPPALACFLIGFIGLLSVEIQLVAVSPLAHKYSERAVQSADDFSATIATSINNTMYNQSAAYANDINGRVDHVQSTINDGLFGWVNGTTTTLNDTINGFYDDLQNAVSTVFNGTILESPIQEFIRCFIGSKVDAIENALTFLHDNLVINIPRVNEAVLVLSPDDVNEATRPIATAAVGGGDGNSEGIVGKLVNAYIASLKKERIMFSVFIGLWGLVVLMALVVIFWHSYWRPWMETYKKRQWRRKNRTGLESVIFPYQERGSNDSIEKPHLHLDATPAQNDAFLVAAPTEYRNPALAKSWESIIEQVPETTPSSAADGSPRISSPRRLMALGGLKRENGSFGRATPTRSDSDTPIWMKPFTTAFWRTKSESSQSALEDKSVSDEKTSARGRPNLHIATNNSIQTTLPSAQEENHLSAEPPASAWSVSPNKPGWLSNIVPSKPKRPTLRPKHQRASSVPVPTDVLTTPDSPPVIQNNNPFAVPLYHGFDKPDSPVSRPPPPVLQFPPYPSQVPTYMNHHLSPPPSSKLLQKPDTRRKGTDPDRAYADRWSQWAHTRQPSLGGDPFATPFDDEHRVANDARRTSARKSLAANPFVALAI